MESYSGLLKYHIVPITIDRALSPTKGVFESSLQQNSIYVFYAGPKQPAIDVGPKPCDLYQQHEVDRPAIF